MSTANFIYCDGCHKSDVECHEISFHCGYERFYGHACSKCLPDGVRRDRDFQNNLESHNELKAKLICSLLNLRAPKGLGLVLFPDPVDGQANSYLQLVLKGGAIYFYAPLFLVDRLAKASEVEDFLKEAKRLVEK